MSYKEIVIIVIIITIKYLNSHSCGQPKIRPHPETHFKIAGGTMATPFSWPWMTYITLHTSTVSGYFGGTLINDKWVLTVTHPFRYGETLDIIIKLGIFDRKKCPPGYKEFHISKWQLNTSLFTHPGFTNGSSNVDDIALIKLSQSIDYTDHISPVCLPRDDNKVNVYGTPVWITGWGRVNSTTRIDKLRQAHILIRTELLEYYCPGPYFDGKRQICAGLMKFSNYTERRGTCGGDSGGPLVWKNATSNKWFQYGVDSAGRRPCEKGNSSSADEYTRVAYYCDWIEKTIGESICLPKK